MGPSKARGRKQVPNRMHLTKPDARVGGRESPRRILPRHRAQTNRCGLVEPSRHVCEGKPAEARSVPLDHGPQDQGNKLLAGLGVSADARRGIRGYRSTIEVLMGVHLCTQASRDRALTAEGCGSK